jgi:cytochrome c-type biogenesis protein CcmE
MDVTDVDDGGSLDAGDGGAVDLDLRPRPATSPRRRRGWAIAVIVVILGALAFIATKALSDASLFFYNADEAIAKHDELGDKRFRLQGTVESNTITDTSDGVDFVVTFNGAEVKVHHRGDPPELFKAGEPVVLEGRWDRTVDVFDSDRMLVKHDERYDANNPDRIKQAEQGGSVPVTSTP